MFNSKVQNEIYNLLCEEGLSIKAIANRRQTSLKAVYKTINILKKKGKLSRGFKAYEKERGTIEPFFKDLGKNKPKIRLHGQQFRIKIISSSEKYGIIKKKSNIFKIDGSTVCLHKNSLSVFNTNSYVGNDETSALALASGYIDKLLWKLEEKLNIIIVKSDYTNSKIVRSHYAETQNGLAKDLERKDLKLKITTDEDGKIWLMVDNSFNLHEFEHPHPVSNADDMFIMRPFFNDLRGNPEIMLPSKMHKNILVNYRSIENHQKSIKSTNSIVDNMGKLVKDVSFVLKDVIEGKIPIKSYDPDVGGDNNQGVKDDLSEADYFG